jgi:hypothetical protein
LQNPRERRVELAGQILCACAVVHISAVRACAVRACMRACALSRVDGLRVVVPCP